MQHAPVTSKLLLIPQLSQAIFVLNLDVRRPLHCFLQIEIGPCFEDYTQQGRATRLSQDPETQRRGREVEWRCPCQGGYRGLGLERRFSTISNPPSWSEREGDEGKSDNGVTAFSITAGEIQRRLLPPSCIIATSGWSFPYLIERTPWHQDTPEKHYGKVDCLEKGYLSITLREKNRRSGKRSVDCFGDYPAI